MSTCEYLRVLVSTLSVVRWLVFAEACLYVSLRRLVWLHHASSSLPSRRQNRSGNLGKGLASMIGYGGPCFDVRAEPKLFISAC